jgi:lipopolysaccharide/colanic/teichoic acid biosynthesis glycosyltransferase
MIKRSFDIVFSLVALILLCPLFCLLGAIILIDSQGGVFYKQRRVGLFGKPFDLIKFRTMHKHADQFGLLTVGEKDPRVTRVGYFLRQYKLDELPQLLNVFLGDMSIVGPRPEVHKYVNLYNNEQREILSIRPGLTDYSSLYYMDENKKLKEASDPEKIYIHEIMPHKLLLARKYMDEKSLLVDLKIIFTTLMKIWIR